MITTVAVVDKDSFKKGIEFIGGIEDLNQPTNLVVIKVGIYNQESGMCTTVNTLNSIINSFDKVKDIRLIESDSDSGPGLKRLEIWNDCYNSRVVPFNLSDDKKTIRVNVVGEDVPLSHVLFAPNVFISTHVLRRYQETGDEDLMNMGSIIKNLLGLIPDKLKFRFHDQLPNALLDIYEGIGGIDLAILDGTSTYLGWKKERTIVKPNFLIIGRDAFAVEAVGAYLLGFEPTEMRVLQEAKSRELGEIDIDRINIIGDIEKPKDIISEAFKELSVSTVQTIRS